MDTSDLPQSILNLVNREGYRPVKPRKIAEQLKVPKSEAVDVKKAVKALVAAGKLAYGPDHLVQPADAVKAPESRIVGVFRRKEGGFGFVRPSGAAASETEVRDIFIPAHKAGDASSGDVVAVRVKGKQGGGGRKGPSGEIVEVLERETHQFVGTYNESAGAGLVAIDGGLFTRPIAVGDAAARMPGPATRSSWR